MRVSSRAGEVLIVICTIFMSFNNVTSTPQRNRQVYQPDHILPPPLGHGLATTPLALSPMQGKVAPAYGTQLQNLDQPIEYETPNYDFKYQIHGGGNYFGHEETRRDYKTQGQYHVLLPDGRRQVVTYYADETGYHPTITYELIGVPPPSNQKSYPNPTKNDGYRSKRSRYYKHSKRVHLKHPVSFKNSA